LNSTGNHSAIYYEDETQKDIALETSADVEASGLWPGKVVTEVEPEHQDYLEHHSGGYSCHYPRPD
jgi:peptide-methionine (S)-S-oxide reductase